MTVSMRSETFAKTVCSEVFGIFSKTLVNNQVRDKIRYGTLEYRVPDPGVYTDCMVGLCG
jgi:hypothetical protein